MSLIFWIIFYQQSVILNWSVVCDRLKYFQLYALGQAVLKTHLFHTDWTILSATCSFNIECMLRNYVVCLSQPRGCCIPIKVVVVVVVVELKVFISVMSYYRWLNCVLNNNVAYFCCLITFAKEVMFSPLSIYLSVCLSVCLLTGLLTNYRSNLYEFYWMVGHNPWDQSFRFWVTLTQCQSCSQRSKSFFANNSVHFIVAESRNKN